MIAKSHRLVSLDHRQLRSVVGGAGVDYTPFGKATVVQPGGGSGGSGGGGHKPPGALGPEILHVAHEIHMIHMLLHLL